MDLLFDLIGGFQLKLLEVLAERLRSGEPLEASPEAKAPSALDVLWAMVAGGHLRYAEWYVEGVRGASP